MALVFDLFSRKVIDSAARPIVHHELALDAILMAVRTRNSNEAITSSDQGSQYGCNNLYKTYRTNNLEPSISRRGNC